MILAWTGPELWCGQARDWCTDWHTHGHTHTDAGDGNTRRPKLALGKKITWWHYSKTSKISCPGFNTTIEYSNKSVVNNRYLPRKLKLTKVLSQYKKNKVNLRDLIAATSLVVLLSIGFKSLIFSARVTLIFDKWHKRTIGHLFYTTSTLRIISNPLVNPNWSYSPETLNSG